MEPTMEPPTHRDMTSPTTKCRENQIKRLAQRAEAHRVSPPWLNSPHRVMAGITRVITLGDNLYFKVRPSYHPLKFSDGRDSRRLSTYIFFCSSSSNSRPTFPRTSWMKGTSHTGRLLGLPRFMRRTPQGACRRKAGWEAPFVRKTTVNSRVNRVKGSPSIV